MRRVLFCACWLAFGLFLMQPSSATDPAVDAAEKMQGRWTIEKGVNQGRDLADSEIIGNLVLVEKNIITTYDRGQKEIYRASYRLKLGSDPVQIDMTTKMQGRKETKALGIVKFDGDRWWLCYGLPGEDRPGGFKSPDGSKVMLFEMKRDKDDE